MKWLLVALVGSVGLVAHADDGLANQKVQLEMRWAETKPIDGQTTDKSIEISCTPDKVYLHTKPIITSADIFQAERSKPVGQIGGVERFFVELTLKNEGAKRLSASLTPNKGKPLVVLVDGKIVAAMVVQTQLQTTIPLTGFFTKEEAERIVQGLTPKK